MPGIIEEVTEISPEVLADFRVLTEQAEQYRRQSYGRSAALPLRAENRRAFRFLSHYLLLIGDLVRRHPELREEYKKWRRLYPTFAAG